MTKMHRCIIEITGFIDQRVSIGIHLEIMNFICWRYLFEVFTGDDLYDKRCCLTKMADVLGLI